MNADQMTKEAVPRLIESSPVFQEIRARIKKDYGLELRAKPEGGWSVPVLTQTMSIDSESDVEMIGEPSVDAFSIAAGVYHNDTEILSGMLDSGNAHMFLSDIASAIEPIVAKNIGEIEFEGDEDSAKLLAITFEDETSHILLRPGDKLNLIVSNPEDEKPKPAAKKKASRQKGALRPPAKKKATEESE